jgi:hypothetical protein
MKRKLAKKFNFRKQKETLDDIIAIFSSDGEVFSVNVVPPHFREFARRFGYGLEVTAHIAGQDHYPGWKITPSTLTPIVADIRIGDEVVDKTGQLNRGLKMTVSDVNLLQALVTYYDGGDTQTWANKAHLELHSRPEEPFI